MFKRLLQDFYKENPNVIGNYFIDHRYTDVDRRISKLATQQVLGIWSKWWHRTGIGNTDHLVAAGTVVISAG